MSGHIGRVFEEVTLNTFRAYTSVLPSSDEVDDGNVLRAAVMFVNPQHCGMVEVSMPGPVLANLAARMLDDDGPITLADRVDVIGEVANIIAGNILPVVDTNAMFDLTPPRIVAACVEPEGSEVASVDVPLAGGTAVSRLFLNS